MVMYVIYICLSTTYFYFRKIFYYVFFVFVCPTRTRSEAHIHSNTHKVFMYMPCIIINFFIFTAKQTLSSSCHFYLKYFFYVCVSIKVSFFILYAREFFVHMMRVGLQIQQFIVKCNESDQICILCVAFIYNLPGQQNRVVKL